MTELRRRMIEDMQLRGLTSKTRDSYVGAVKRLSQHYRRSPDLLTEEDLRDYFLYLVNEKGVSEATLRLYLCGIKFFFETTLGRKWRTFDLVRPRKRGKLPVVLTPQEVRDILSRLRSPVVRMALKTIYSCGLRLSEGASLRVSDVDAGRMLIRVRRGKGGRDRYVPLPCRTLELLRVYRGLLRRKFSSMHLFPSKLRSGPIAITTLQKSFKSALQQSEIEKEASVHTLRHSYATHLLENGISLKVIQEILGHRSVQTTLVYTHLTRKTVEMLHATVDRVMADL